MEQPGTTLNDPEESGTLGDNLEQSRNIQQMTEKYGKAGQARNSRQQPVTTQNDIERLRKVQESHRICGLGFRNLAVEI